jgi:hypothetical protein
MGFRWIAILTLWTMLIGPMLNAPLSVVNSRPAQARTK